MQYRKRRPSFRDWLTSPFTHRGAGHEPDRTLLIVVLILLFVGLIFLSSASSTLAFYRFEDTYYFIKQQVLHGLLPGLVIFYIAARVEYTKYERFTAVFLGASLLLLVLVFFTNLGNDYGTAKSWIDIGNISFQPSEFVKLLYVIYLAGWIAHHGKNIRSFGKGTLPFAVILGLISSFMLLQPDVGTLSIIVFTALAMFFAGGAKISHLLAILAAGVAGLLAMVKTAPYRLNRFIAWFNPDLDPQGIGWQLKQSLIAVGSGGWFGMGLGASRQKSYLPQPANDSVFAVVAEEIGFIFTLVFIGLFIILIWRGFKIARRSPDLFARMLAIGISVWIAWQVFVNIAGLIQMLPLTGVPLTFVSLGGSNMIVSLAAMGILSNISRFTR